MSIFDNFPLSNAYTINLDWILKKIREIEKYVQDYTAVNKVAYAGVWDITKQYPQWALVTDGDTSWLSNKPVPVGIPLENTEYWQKLADLDPRIAGIIVQLSNVEKQLSDVEKTLVEVRNDMPKVYANVAEMQKSDVKIGNIAITQGFYSVNDGGDGIYVISDEEPNGFNKLRCVNGCATLINDDGNIARYGAENGKSIDDILDFAKSKNFLKIPIGTYKITRTHAVENMEIAGTDRKNSILSIVGNDIVMFTLGIHCTMRNFTVSSDIVGKNTAFETTGSFDWFEDVSVKDVYKAFAVKCSNVTLLNVFTYNIYHDCVELNSDSSDVVNVNITSCRFWGHQPGGCRGIYVGGTGNATEGLKVANTDIDFCDNGIEIRRHFLEFEFVNVVVDQIYRNGFVIENDGIASRGLSVTNCYFGRNGNAKTTDYLGANIFGKGELSSVKFTNCFFDIGNAATFRSLYNEQTQDFKAWFISGCTFIAPESGEPNLIIDSVNGLLIDKCYFPNSGTTLCVNLANNKGLSGSKGNIDRCVCTDVDKILVSAIYTKTNIYTL